MATCNSQRICCSGKVPIGYLSKQIKALEQNLDVSLLTRNSNTIALTENGKIFLQYSERILALCEESCRALIDLKNGERGNLRVGASQTIGTYLMPRLLAGLPPPNIPSKASRDSLCLYKAFNLAGLIP